MILLPLAAASGWWMGWRSALRSKAGSAKPLSAEYFAGLNYLLNEQPDRAVDLFTRMIDVDSDTIEVHYALATLFLKRGEVDRAIRIHENLIARPTLTQQQQHETRFRLGNDYLRAGMLDRAEGIFSDLVNTPEHAAAARHHLLEIYQREKDWGKAIATAERLKKYKGADLKHLIAHYFCELACQFVERGDHSKAGELLQQALANDPRCARASIMEGDLTKKLGQAEAAILAYQRVVRQDPSLMPEILERLVACYRAIGKLEEGFVRIHEIHAVHPGIGGALMLMRLGREVNREQDGRRILRDYLRKEPSVAGALALLEAAGGETEVLSDVCEILKRLGARDVKYCCHHCGFAGQRLHWQCPGCQSWDTIRAV
ncbi:MAG: lipopolysaccharide assembly protein LapB [Pseudomonadota bacterium]